LKASPSFDDRHLKVFFAEATHYLFQFLCTERVERWRRTEGESSLRLEIVLDGCVGRVEKSRLVLSQVSLRCQIILYPAPHLQYHKNSVLFRLTSTSRYVVVLQDDVIDFETISTNLHQNSASPQDLS